MVVGGGGGKGVLSGEGVLCVFEVLTSYSHLCYECIHKNLRQEVMQFKSTISLKLCADFCLVNK